MSWKPSAKSKIGFGGPPLEEADLGGKETRQQTSSEECCSAGCSV
jgi:hypothetical protein